MRGPITALLTMHQLMAGLDDDGVLSRHLQPMMDKLQGMLGADANEARELMRRVKVISTARRRAPSRHFELLGSAVVPLCLVLIGMSLPYYGMRGAARAAVALSVLKLLVLPALVLVIARWGFGLAGLPLAVVVMMAALPVGSNALIFSQRYETLEAEATAAIVLSTVAFGLTAPLWLAVLAALGPPRSG